MRLFERMAEDGKTLFRWRSYIPLLFIAPLMLAFQESAHMEALMGDAAEDVWVLFSFAIALAGLALRAYTVGFVPAGTSGRNAKAQRAERLNTTGMYSIVRNPLYLANFIILLGVVLSLKVWWLAVIVTLAFFAYMERIIMAEEAFLSEKFGTDYAAWCAKTPVILPKLSLWQKPDMPFSIKTVLKREYQGLLAIVTAFFTMEIVSDFVFEKDSFSDWISDDKEWVLIYGLVIFCCLTLRYLKKHTTLLHVAGR